MCGWVGGGGGRGIPIVSQHCHHQSDSCIKMGSGESHFNVSLIVSGKVTRQRPQEKRRERRVWTSRCPQNYFPLYLAATMVYGSEGGKERGRERACWSDRDCHPQTADRDNIYRPMNAKGNSGLSLCSF